MSAEKMRADFEAWIAERISNNGVSHWLKRKPSEDLIDNGGPYQMIWVEAAWQGWQASRAALVVDLPPKISEFNTDENGFVNPAAAEHDEAIDDCRDAIEAAGVKVKA